MIRQDSVGQIMEDYGLMNWSSWEAYEVEVLANGLNKNLYPLDMNRVVRIVGGVVVNPLVLLLISSAEGFDAIVTVSEP